MARVSRKTEDRSFCCLVRLSFFSLALFFTISLYSQSPNNTQKYLGADTQLLTQSPSQAVPGPHETKQDDSNNGGDKNEPFESVPVSQEVGEHELLKIPMAYRQNVLFDWGGWVRHQGVWFQDRPIDPNRRFQVEDLRLWGALNLGKYQSVYARVKTQYTAWGKGDAQTVRTYEFINPGLDQGFYNLRLARGSLYETDLTLGRQSIVLGRGIGLLGTFDGAKLENRYHAFSSTLFFVHTIGSVDDVDQSRPNAGYSRRSFLGIQGRYENFFGNNNLYLYFLRQQDLNSKHPDAPTQNFRYNSQYVGTGINGQFLANAPYYLAGIYEWGKSVPTGSLTERDPIRAWALDAGVSYLFDYSIKPKLELEYMFGSGDKDRGSVTNTVGGNTPGTKDTNFIPFGFIQTGYALFPQLSNLHIIRVGGLIQPFQSNDSLKRLSAGIDTYFYVKDKKTGVISDFRADRTKRSVGMEVDTSIRWRTFSDLSISFIYAHFIPGSAYSQRQSRNFFTLSVIQEF